MNGSEFCYPEGKGLKACKTKPIGDWNKADALEQLEKNKKRLFELQDMLYAQGKHALLVILQGMDTSGKDSAIKHVMTGLNPQGIRVTGFKSPTVTELKHDYMWRTDRELPSKGEIGIFNRSYYEDVLIVRVHELVPGHDMNDKEFWKMRFRQIRHKEEYLLENQIIPMKFFLNISKEEQTSRLLKRIDDPSKNWKFDISDMKERAYWPDYITAYEDCFEHTSTKQAPWYIVPADKKWYARLVISELMIKQLEELKLSYPKISDEQKKNLQNCRAVLLQEQEERNLG